MLRVFVLWSIGAEAVALFLQCIKHAPALTSAHGSALIRPVVEVVVFAILYGIIMWLSWRLAEALGQLAEGPTPDKVYGAAGAYAALFAMVVLVMILGVGAVAFAVAKGRADLLRIR
jgi:hypothetical protein